MRATAPRAPVVKVDPPSAKRAKRSNSGSATAGSAEAEARRERLKQQGMVESSSDEEDTVGGGQPQKTANEEAVHILETWNKHKARINSFDCCVMRCKRGSGVYSFRPASSFSCAFILFG